MGQLDDRSWSNLGRKYRRVSKRSITARRTAPTGVVACVGLHQLPNDEVHYRGTAKPKISRAGPRRFLECGLRHRLLVALLMIAPLANCTASDEALSSGRAVSPKKNPEYESFCHVGATCLKHIRPCDGRRSRAIGELRL
jgi:hypothetical protein